MFRAAAFSIVFVLAAGQNARLLCDVRCEPPPAAARSCHQRNAPTSSASMTGVAPCHDRTAISAFVIENVWRGTAAGRTLHAITAVPYRLYTSSRAAGPRHGMTRLGSRVKRPLDTALRI